MTATWGIAGWLRGTVLLLVAITATVGFSGAAEAQVKSTKDARSSAREVYGEATRQYDMNDFAGALDGFKRAYALHPDPVILYNMAQCYRQMGDEEQAIKFYKSYLRNSTKASNAEEVAQLITALEQSANAKRAERERQQAEEQDLARKRIEAETAERKARAAQLEADAVAKRQALERNDSGLSVLNLPRARKEKIAGLATAGGGIALMAVGAAFAALAKQESDSLTSSAAKGGTYDPSRASAGSRDQTLGVAFLAGGGLAVVAGAVVYGLGYRDSKSWSLSASASTTSASVAFARNF